MKSENELDACIVGELLARFHAAGLHAVTYPVVASIVDVTTKLVSQGIDKGELWARETPTETRLQVKAHLSSVLTRGRAKAI